MKMSSPLLAILVLLLAVQGNNSTHLDEEGKEKVSYETVEYVEAGVAAVLERIFKTQERILTGNEKEKAWEYSKKCIEDISKNKTEFKIFLEWYHLDHFAALQVVKAKNYYWRTNTRERFFISVFRPLVDMRFSEAFELNISFPAERNFTNRKKFTIEVIKIACSNVNGDGKRLKNLPVEAKRKIKGAVMRKIFFALIREDYTSDLDKRGSWKRLGRLMKKPNSKMQNSCFGMSAVNNDIDPVIADIRKIAVKLGVKQCKKTVKEVQQNYILPLLTVSAPFDYSFSYSYSYAPPAPQLERSAAPGMSIGSIGSAPDNNPVFPNAAPSWQK